MSQTQKIMQKIGHEKILGEHSWTAGEIIGLAIGGFLILRPVKQLGDKWSRILGLVIIAATEALF